MSSPVNDGSTPSNVRSAEDADAQARIGELLEERQRHGGGASEVPAGGAGADSGAAAAVGVDDVTDEAAAAEVESYNSEHNDEPGIGNRGRD